MPWSVPVLYHPKSKYDENFAFRSFFFFVLKINGFWPTHGDENCNRFRILQMAYTIFSYVMIVCITLSVATEFAYMAKFYVNASEAVENMSTILVGVQICVRMYHMRYKMASFKTVMGVYAERIWINKETHPVIFERCIGLMKPLFYVSVGLSSGITLYIVTPIYIILKNNLSIDSPNKPLPYYMLFPYDHQIPAYYYPTFAWCVYLGYMAILQSCAMDVLFSHFVSFTCGQFELLHGRIVRLIPDCHEEWRKSYGNKCNTMDYKTSLEQLQMIYNTRLHQISVDHSELLRYCVDLENLYAFPLMANMLVSSLIISFGGFQLIISGQNSIVNFVRFLLYLVSVSIQLYAVCYLGTSLISLSTKTAHYLSMCNWEGGFISRNSPLIDESDVMEAHCLNQKQPLWKHIDYPSSDVNFRRKLSFMILRSNRPAKLTAMKFAEISLETFNQILSTSVSFFAVLKTFMDRIA